jgi:hypothetical protein
MLVAHLLFGAVLGAFVDRLTLPASNGPATARPNEKALRASLEPTVSD